MEKVIISNSGTVFSTKIPLSMINTGPHFAYMWAGVPSCVSGPSVPVGTIFASRHGDEDGKARIKTDEWLVYAKGNNFLAEDIVDKVNIPDHHTMGTPTMFNQAPEGIKSLFKK